jgi:NitT/TauT family transport system substrate-binding protein
MSSREVLRIVLVLSLGLLIGCGPQDREETSQSVTLAMGFVPNVQFAPFYVAVDRGYFADEGIELEFDYGWETDLLKLVASNELQFAIGSGDQVILARSQELPVVYVMNWYRRFPVCVVSLAGTGIHSPAELVGRRVGTPALYGASYIGWRALIDAVGLDEASIELVSIGYEQAAALTEGQVDAALCYAMNEPVEMMLGGQEVNIIYVADYANLVSNGLFTNEETIKDNPELVQGMVRASLRGLAYTIDHPDEAYDISVRHISGATGDAGSEAVNRAVLAESIEFWRADAGQLGRVDEAQWRAAQSIMYQMGLVGEEGDVADMFTNRFIVEVEP